MSVGGNRTVAEIYAGGAAGLGPARGAVMVAGCVWVGLMGVCSLRSGRRGVVGVGCGGHSGGRSWCFVVESAGSNKIG